MNSVFGEDRTLAAMQPIGLDDMKAVRLMNRVDQKYLAPACRLAELLERVGEEYYVQRVAGEAVSPYKTLYFDTAERVMYLMHHNCKLGRQKVRVRTYRSTDTTFFEVKTKDNKRKTSKVRIPVEAEQFYRVDTLEEVRRFLWRNTPYRFAAEGGGEAAVQACLENRFNRITLVDKGMSERVTLDSGIAFHNHATGRDADIGGLMVIEVKHEAGAPPSAIERALHTMHISPCRMSKYCIGTALTDPTVKHNRFKAKLLRIDKITNPISA